MSSKSRRSTDPRPDAPRGDSAGHAARASIVKRSFYVESLGCAKNQVDSELMIAALRASGWSLARSPDDAALIVVNTCGFISDAKKESIETSLEMKALHPGARVVMAGCLSERYAGDLRGELAEIDAFLGNRNPADIVETAEGLFSKGRRAAAKTEAAPAAPAGKASGGRRARAPRSFEREYLLSYPGSAFLKIAEGCSNRCSYCAIPLIRGECASRDRADILREARGLLDRGARELVLIAQDLGAYGVDRAGSPQLPALLSELSGLKGDFWVRMLYIHPDHFPLEILEIADSDKRILPYFDIPFQHGSPGILRAMGRRNGPEANLELIAAIRGRLPDAVVRSTFLVGFPGETDGEFQRLLDFQDAARLDWLGAFAYSREEDTPAYAMAGRVSPAVARRRKGEVERRQVPITERALDGYVGRSLDALVEERIEGERMCLARGYLQAPEVDGLIVVNESLEPGTLHRVRITRRNGLDLEAEVSDA